MAFYNTEAHFLWIGDHTRQLTGAHVEYFRGFRNLMIVKVGPCMQEELVRLLDGEFVFSSSFLRLCCCYQLLPCLSLQAIHFRHSMKYLTTLPFPAVNPDKEAGRVTVITRYGATKYGLLCHPATPTISSTHLYLNLLLTTYHLRIVYRPLLRIVNSPFSFSPTLLSWNRPLPSFVLRSAFCGSSRLLCTFFLILTRFFFYLEMAILEPLPCPLAQCAHSPTPVSIAFLFAVRLSVRFVRFALLSFFLFLFDLSFIRLFHFFFGPLAYGLRNWPGGGRVS